MASKTELVAAAADAIEAELRAIGAWEDTLPSPEKMDFKRAFAMDTLAFTQWIQFVLLVRVRGMIEAGSPLPASSQVGVHAVREFDGQPEAATLKQLLCEFDYVVEHGVARSSTRSNDE
jgi:uncharacterized protein YqcC (DUF446 family)